MARWMQNPNTGDHVLVLDVTVGETGFPGSLAVVEMTPEMATEMVKMYEAFNAFRGSVPGALEIQVRDYSAQFCRPSDEDEECPDWDSSEDDLDLRTEVNRLSLDVFGDFYWTAVPKHLDLTDIVSTEPIRVAALEAFIAGDNMWQMGDQTQEGA